MQRRYAFKLLVERMSCGSCAHHLETALTNALGPSRLDTVHVNATTKSAEVVLRAVSPQRVSEVEAEVKLIVSGAGYEAVQIRVTPLADLAPSVSSSGTTSLRTCSGSGTDAGRAAEVTQPTSVGVRVSMLVEGMSCGSCAAHLERNIEERLPPLLLSSPSKHEAEPEKVQSTSVTLRTVEVNFAVKRAVVTFRVEAVPNGSAITGDRTDEQRLSSLVAQVIRDSGYTPGSATTTTTTTTSSTTNHTTTTAPKATASYESFVIHGMSCASCAQHIESSVRAKYVRSQGGLISECTVNFGTSTMTLHLSQDVLKSLAHRRVAVTEIIGFVEELGYQVATPKWLRDGAEAEQQPQPVATGDGASSPTRRPLALVGESAAEATDETRRALERTHEIQSQRQKFIGSLFFTVPLVVAMIFSMADPVLDDKLRVQRCIWLHSAEMLLATPVVFFFGSQFFVRAYQGFRHRILTMDTLIAIGVGSSYLFSFVALLLTVSMGIVLKVYFDAAATLTTFMLLGRYLEATAKRHTSGALIHLMSLVPATASVVRLPVNSTTAGAPDTGLEGMPVDIVPSATLEVGQVLRVLAGDRIPTDGVARAGVSDVDEQIVSGESVPRTVRPGDSVTGGTLNLSATLYVEATRVGEATTLANILRIVQDAQSTKPAIQRVADRIAGVFVPIVVSYALAVLVVWLILGALNAYPESWREGESSVVFAFSYFVATIVVACPCALGLATPTAVMVGTGVGAANGVLIKSGAMLEVASDVTCVVFDKTGTLTQGKLDVVGCEYFSTLMANEKERANSDPGDERAATDRALVRSAVATLESMSRHPIAVSIAQFLTTSTVPSTPGSSGSLYESPTVLNCTTHPGYGVSGELSVVRRSGKASADTSPLRIHLAVGSLNMMRHPEEWFHSERSGDANSSSATTTSSRPQPSLPCDDLVAFTEKAQRNGNTVVVAAVDGVSCMAFALADRPKPEAYGVVQYLQDHNIRVMMVTGDHTDVAASIASCVGIRDAAQNVIALALPAEKAATIRRLQDDEKHIVAFVGDGINDSPALAQANLGVAIGAGTEVAIEAADAVLMRSSLVDLLTYLSLAKTTVRRIKGNFVWALMYNVVMLPFASGVFVAWWQYQLSPIVAGMAMVCSSLTVLMSSLLLRCFRPVRIAGEGLSSIVATGASSRTSVPIPQSRQPDSRGSGLQGRLEQKVPLLNTTRQNSDDFD